MAIVVEATYERGILRPQGPIELPEGAKVELTITPLGEPHDPLKPVIGIGDSGRTDGAEHHDRYVYGHTRP